MDNGTHDQAINMNTLLYTTEAAIKELIDSSAEESLILEFKSGGAFEKTDPKKREIAKDVSALANSAGGTLIYGITETDHKAASLSPVDGSVYTKEWLQQVIHTNVFRPIEQLIIHPIRLEGDIKRTIYVIQVPESHAGPHMVDKKFYRRYNFECVAMEEHEVRQSYFRTRTAQLRLLDLVVSPAGASSSAGKFNKVNFKIDFQVENYGQVMEQHYKLEIWMPELMRHEIHTVSAMNKSLTRKELTHSVYSIPSASPLFSQEKTTLVSAIAIVEKGTLFHLRETPVICKLYYSGGVQELTLNLSEHLVYGGEKLSMEMFVS